MKISIRKSLSLLLCLVLITAMALTTTACNDNNGANISSAVSASSEVKEMGEGKNSFSFIVTDKDGNKSSFLINTDKTIIGEALQELGLLSGEEGQFGLYVKTVNGISADFDTDGCYWAFYVDGKYGNSGVDTTEYKEGSVYEFRVEK